jgi:hypothetical protein
MNRLQSFISRAASAYRTLPVSRQALPFIGMLVICAAGPAHAASVFDLPIVTDILCGFLNFCRSQLVPILAAVLVVFAVLGHLMGISKMWGMLLYIAFGLGLIGGAGSYIVRAYPAAGASCIA